MIIRTDEVWRRWDGLDQSDQTDEVWRRWDDLC